MRISVAIAGAATLGSTVVSAQKEANAIGIPAPQDLLNLVGNNVAFDACHKIDTSADGLIWPCASVLRTRVQKCPRTVANPAEQKAQRDCLCAEPSSYVADEAACAECKFQNGLQPQVQKKYWEAFFKEVQTGYCDNKEETRSYEKFFDDLRNKMGDPPAGGSINQHPGKVIDPTVYYKDAGFEVPKVQGPGKFTPAAAAGEDAVKNVTAPAVAAEEPAGHVQVPVFVAIEMPANDTKPATSTVSTTSRPPFQNGTAIVSGKPSTLTTLTSTTSVLSATPIAPTPAVPAAPGAGSDGVTIVINGKVCKIVVVYVTVGCSPAQGSSGSSITINFDNKGVDTQQPVYVIGSNKQFEEIKEALPDAGKDVNLADEVNQIVGGEGKPVVVAPSKPSGNGEQQRLPPPMQESVKVPSSGNKPSTGKPATGNNGRPGAQPAQNAEQEDESKPAAPGAPGSSGDNSNKPAAPAPGAPGQDGSKTPAQNGNNGSSAPSKPAETCPPCPTTAATARPDAKDICKKKSDKETECLGKGDVATIQACLCSGKGFEDNRFFDDAIICARRSGSNPAQGEFEAQIFFEVKFRYCEKKSVPKFGDAYAQVDAEWREARQPRKELS
ncbi:hypothetical protein ISF_06858 [Cordyceps fumosorosea ARSEF 2679]|uniref:Uncharacterized protein n=1 Tax=Cordyceps fumosorosea (strain ARSEF 2679) TaxID=1081104 RepID=A0A167R6L7_CORFA|nr:hypothetical protein ISF_06858 [Cordyceps fumosorosea ARSEF 2679]OAA58319.1 hypothetical protein ISF_06858 [Cordyceps fumosorosea ARSEF 2679]